MSLKVDKQNIIQVKSAVVELLRSAPSLAHICAKLNINYSMVADWKRDDKAFNQCCKDALEEKVDFIEGTQIQEAMSGNTAAARDVLKARMPEIYGDKASGGREPVQIIIHEPDSDRIQEVVGADKDSTSETSRPA